MAQNLSNNHWTRAAACNFDTNLMSYHIDDVDDCIETCRSCSVKKECFDWVVEIDGHFVASETTRYDRLLTQWKRVKDLSEHNFE
jgi:hypothetical protein